MRPCSPFVHSKSRKGENGSPWQMPLVGWIVPLGSLFTKIEYETVVTHTA